MTVHFALVTDKPDWKQWMWDGYTIDWEPLPADGAWTEDWQYVLTHETRSVCCGFASIHDAIECAARDAEAYS